MEHGWVIEYQEAVGVQFHRFLGQTPNLSLNQYTSNPHKAVRFRTKEDAEVVIAALRYYATDRDLALFVRDQIWESGLTPGKYVIQSVGSQNAWYVSSRPEDTVIIWTTDVKKATTFESESEAAAFILELEKRAPGNSISHMRAQPKKL